MSDNCSHVLLCYWNTAEFFDNINDSKVWHTKDEYTQIVVRSKNYKIHMSDNEAAS